MPWLHARGRLEAVVAIADLPADAAAALLPAGLELVVQDFVPVGRHPLILLFGEHAGVGPGWLPFGLRYRELVLALPCVRPQSGPAGPFTHLPLLLLDRSLPTLLGRWLYGFAKRRATVRRTPDGFAAMRRSDGAALLEARCGPIAGAPDLGPIRGLLEQPLISGGSGGRWRYARFDFGFERAEVGGIEVAAVVHPGLLPGLPVGPLRPGKAFRLATAWTLSPGSRPSPKRGRS